MKLIETVVSVLYLFLLFEIGSSQNEVKVESGSTSRLRFVTTPIADEEVERQFMALKVYRHHFTQNPPTDEFNKKVRKIMMDDFMQGKKNLNLLLTVHNKLKNVEENGNLITNTNTTVWDSYGWEIKWKHLFTFTPKETKDDEIDLLTRKVLSFKDSVMRMSYYDKKVSKMAAAVARLHNEVCANIQSFNFDHNFNSKLYFEVLLDPEIKELADNVLEHL